MLKEVLPRCSQSSVYEANIRVCIRIKARRRYSPLTRLYTTLTSSKSRHRQLLLGMPQIPTRQSRIEKTVVGTLHMLPSHTIQTYDNLTRTKHEDCIIYRWHWQFDWPYCHYPGNQRASEFFSLERPLRNPERKVNYSYKATTCSISCLYNY